MGARRLAQLQGRHAVHLLHIGKTGGTAIKKALEPHRKTKEFEIFLHGHETTLAQLPKGDRVVFFLRDPVSRFVSGFFSRQRQGRPRYDVPWSADERASFERYKTPNQLARALASPDAAERRQAQRAMRSIRHVRDSFWRWFGDESLFRSRAAELLFVGFQERLADDFSTLRALLGVPERATLPEDEVGAHRNPAGLNRSLDDDAVAALKSWYAADYEFLELCRKLVDDVR